MKLNKSIKSTREILKENILKGKLAEEIAKQDYIKNGFKIQLTGIGSDFIARKYREDFLYQEYVDVKSGNAKLTNKQKQTKKLLKKQNISYSIYRVTDHHLEFQIQNNLELQQHCKNMGWDISQFTGIFVIQNPTSCPNCNLTSEGLDKIFSNFGLRNMADKTVRVQSWCRTCRNYSRRGGK
jgi:disulfide oxidoreductase YuzD